MNPSKINHGNIQKIHHDKYINIYIYQSGIYKFVGTVFPRWFGTHQIPTSHAMTDPFLGFWKSTRSVFLTLQWERTGGRIYRRPGSGIFLRLRGRLKLVVDLGWLVGWLVGGVRIQHAGKINHMWTVSSLGLGWVYWGWLGGKVEKSGVWRLQGLVVEYVGFQYLRLFSKPNKTEQFSMSTGAGEKMFPALLFKWFYSMD